MLKKLFLKKNDIKDWDRYPFSVPTIKNLDTLDFSSEVTFFVGENGSGKSTLLESIAVYAGFPEQGGGSTMNIKNQGFKQREKNILKDYIQLVWDIKSRQGFFLRAESFFNVAGYIDDLGAMDAYGGKSLQKQSHGQSFMSLFTNRFKSKGLYILDEPEVALSPKNQILFLSVLDEIIKLQKGTQFIIATHSPILLAYPNAKIYDFSKNKIQKIDYEDTEHFQVTHDFLNDYKRQLFYLLEK